MRTAIIRECVNNLGEEKNKRLYDEITNTFDQHKEIFRTAIIQSVVAYREDIPSRKDKWHNFVSVIKAIPQDTLKPWTVKIEQENFAIVEATVSIEQVKEILKQLYDSQILEVGDYQAHGPFDFQHSIFINSEEAKRTYDLNNSNCIFLGFGTKI